MKIKKKNQQHREKNNINRLQTGNQKYTFWR